jgi:hypothetical protein
MLTLHAYSPDWIDDLVTMLERIYENPVYAEDHPNPYRELEQIDEIVEVGWCTTR